MGTITVKPYGKAFVYEEGLSLKKYSLTKVFKLIMHVMVWEPVENVS